MAYGNYTLERACQAFALELVEDRDLFGPTPDAAIRASLRDALDEGVPLALAIQTEKARSELIIAPLLVEVRRLMKHRISLFSGVPFDIDAERGLNGTCDFILSGSPTQFYLKNPILMIVEAKNDDMKAGMGQCAAEMVAAQLFNKKAGGVPTAIHGAVTTGILWRFLRLEGGTLLIDCVEYHFEHVEKILGILLTCVGGGPDEAGAAA